MADPSYPVGLNFRPRRDSWRVVEPVPPVVRTEMQGGNSRARRSAAQRYCIVEQTLKFTAAEWPTWDTFLKTMIADGTRRFTMSVTIDGFTFVERMVQFIEKTPGVEKAGRFNLVAMKLKVFGV